MRTDLQIKKDFDSVAFFRNIKEQIANELQGKPFDEQKTVLKKIQAGEIKLKPLNEAKRSSDC